MARHGLPASMFIELARPGSTARASIGSDSIYYVPDNRWSRERIVEDIRTKFKSYTDKGWTILGYQPISPSELPLRAL